ncbi:iron-sulfur cluster-binding protein [Puniceicoccales bacterium CK1056]|uniref:Iron-sulfur cluster-binding protein n=1 Tax=Oceanipulchritudo coccoides TaxID=2706888 RepID=A0A6B2M3F3_9BACT|nr:LutB/LldF family L-lactate oxidation iron-sulfur protein [Oceanipulchritudo coccoides]NDV62842.1 iron-sulfur cluster-binding protein [Oceanipulchritudo coccoides]
MKSLQKIDIVARDLSDEVQKSTYLSSKAKTEKRMAILQKDFPEANRLREIAGEIKQHTLEHLDQYLAQAEASLKANGAHVHFANDAESANATILKIMQENGAKRMVKSKSMVTEEIHLLPYLEKHGMEVVETDLGEFIIQIDDDHPSHIVTPIIHKNRKDIAKSFEREGLGDYNDDPETITRRARAFLRQKYLDADVGLTGGNFVSAESGRVSLVTNEGNARFSVAANRIHIAVVGIEKIIPKDRDFSLFLNLIARSATGQQLTVYNQFINGPRSPGQPHGPEQMHVVFLDNRRTEVLASECREILRCIRCGACLNVCPIFRQAGGHAYRSVYPGPVGAVLSPLLAGNRFPELADLPKASSLCGACNEVCPVNIPIPDLLLRLRDKAKREKATDAMKGTPSLGLWATLCSQPAMWKTALSMGHTMNYIPTELIPHPSARAWQHNRKLPKFQGGEFRKWFRNRPPSSK